MNRKIILVIDDQTGFVDLLRRMMPEYELRVEDDPVTALQTARVLQPSLFIIDMVMPAIRGLDLARTLEAETEFAETPIFLLSGLIQSFVEDGEPVLIEGYAAFAKPFKVAILKKHIQRHLAGPESAATALQQLKPGFVAGE